MSTPTKVDVVIIGGGITGLATAYFLQKMAQKPISYVVLEKNASLGGKIQTEHINGFVLEKGPESFLSQKPWALKLALELGLKDELISTNDKERTIYVYKKGRLLPIPKGFMLMVPTQMVPFAFSRLISLSGKIRMLKDIFIPKKVQEDESVASFIRRRLGQEALEYLAEPLLAGIFNSDPEKQSMRATFAQFFELEQRYGSLIRGFFGRKPPKNPSYGTFVSLKKGMSQFVDALSRSLQGDVFTNAEVKRISKRACGYNVDLADNKNYVTSKIVIATDSAYASRLLAEIAPESSRELATFQASSSGCLYLAYPARLKKQFPSGFGAVFPYVEHESFNAITFMHQKLPYRAYEDTVLLRLFFGGFRTPNFMQYDDEQLLLIAQDFLFRIFQVAKEEKPLLSRVYRWYNGNAQYEVGHIERAEKVKKMLPGGVFVAGSPYQGGGIPDCIKQAEETALHIIKVL